MRQLDGRRYWLIGASEGLGAALARELTGQGVHLVLSARSADRLDDLAATLPGGAETVVMDVTDEASVQAAARQVGRVDGMVYLAGVYWPMASQGWQADEAVAMADVNFTGLVRVLGQVVPQMVGRDAGHIVITGSLSGFRGLPGAIGYAASKAGVMALAECLHADLHRSGVDVQLVNPGFIRTRLTARNDFAMPFLMDPDKAAAIIARHMTRRRFARNFPTGFSWVFRLSRLLPESVYLRLFA
ncbi:SDR family NAD(P)-dependent oxidoreductase [Marinibacterium sp. SX1]|uniref:SDR family NAD(P)-dependent oxidoreductase n=1 Tax=Marinibacterium sp. SX1 TaxID=3388424 RepID=UPI003D169D96